MEYRGVNKMVIRDRYLKEKVINYLIDNEGATVIDKLDDINNITGRRAILDCEWDSSEERMAIADVAMYNGYEVICLVNENSIVTEDDGIFAIYVQRDEEGAIEFRRSGIVLDVITKDIKRKMYKVICPLCGCFIIAPTNKRLVKCNMCNQRVENRGGVYIGDMPSSTRRYT